MPILHYWIQILHMVVFGSKFYVWLYLICTIKPDPNLCAQIQIYMKRDVNFTVPSGCIFYHVIFIIFYSVNFIQRKSEEPACASLEPVEAVGNVGNKAILGPKGSSTAAQQMNSLNNANILYTDELRSSVATFNIVRMKSLFIFKVKFLCISWKKVEQWQ